MVSIVVYLAVFAVLYAVFYFFCLTNRPKLPNNILAGPRKKQFKKQTVEVRKEKEGEGPVRRSIEGPPGDKPLPSVLTDKETGKTLATQYESFEHAVQTYGKSFNCLGSREILPGGRRGPYIWKNYNEVQELRDAFRRGLVNLGLKAGDRVGIFSKNREEWVIVEQACYANSFVIVSFYDTLGPDAVKFIAKHCSAKVVVCANENLDALMATVTECPDIEFVVHFDPLNVSEDKLRDYRKVKLHYYQDVLEAGRKPELVKNTKYDAVPPKATDLSTIMYTSGTTGDPKGVLLSHENIISMMNCCNIRVEELVAPGDCYLSYLPLAHILERMVTSMAIYKGVGIGMFSGNVKLLKDDLAVLKPTLFCGVPRVFERIFDQINERVAGGTPLRKFLFKRAILAAKRANELDAEPPLFWSTMVLDRLKAVLGGRVRLMLSGGAPLSPHIHEFLITAFRIPLIQAYGLTETCAGATIAFPKDNQGSIGHVGPPVYCCEIKLVDIPDMNYTSNENPPKGEVLLKGPMVSAGYYKDPSKTQESFKDGWFHTGDIGRWNEDGTLSIIDRKKNLFKLSHGEYIAVEKLEGIYQNASGVAQIWIYGESTKSSLVAIVVPKDGKKDGDTKAMLEGLNNEGKKHGLQGFERLGNIRFAEEEFTEKNNLATPTLKLKRPQLKEKYEKEIEEMYQEIEK
eukprot:TRINITY_DN431_c0_g4_i1.p1 TRINITY_DN431_c0_g4~~TRINITY_DN431_c0_g4_i1.p1  ORF type:complete len:685 (-),score=160.09 TRINITY_DN431_c0_g4_i1:171-2225(-)